MQNVGSENGLKDAILQLEQQQAAQGAMVRTALQITHESLKPINLIKSAFHQAAESRELRSNVINTAVGLTTGYITKRILLKESSNPFKKLLGAAVMFGITNIVAKNPETVRSLGLGLLKIIRSKLTSA